LGSSSRVLLRVPPHFGPRNSLPLSLAFLRPDNRILQSPREDLHGPPPPPPPRRFSVLAGFRRFLLASEVFPALLFFPLKPLFESDHEHPLVLEVTPFLEFSTTPVPVLSAESMELYLGRLENEFPQRCLVPIHLFRNCEQSSFPIFPPV